MTEETKKRRGRPPLSPEMKAERIARKNALTNAYHKRNGYAAQKKYKQTHLEKYHTAQSQVYEPKLRIPIEKKDELKILLQNEGVSLTKMFITLIWEKYGVNLSIKDMNN